MEFFGFPLDGITGRNFRKSFSGNLFEFPGFHLTRIGGSVIRGPGVPTTGTEYPEIFSRKLGGIREITLDATEKKTPGILGETRGVAVVHRVGTNRRSPRFPGGFSCSWRIESQSLFFACVAWGTSASLTKFTLSGSYALPRTSVIQIANELYLSIHPASRYGEESREKIPDSGKS